MAAFPNVAVRNVAGLNIPQHDYIAFTYHGATNNAATVTYREGGATGTIVATVTFTYTTQPPTVDNTPLATVTRSNDLQRSHRRFCSKRPIDRRAAGPRGGTYADLPLDASAPVGSAWRVLAGSGIPLYSRHAAGVYVRSSAGNVNRDSDYTFAGKAVQIVVVKEAA
jgi:hypothetical protein